MFINYRTTGYIIKESDYNRHMQQNISISPNELLLVHNEKGNYEESGNFDTLLVIEDYPKALARAENFRENNLGKAALISSLGDESSLEFKQSDTQNVFGTFANSYGNLEFAGAMASVIDDSVFDSIEKKQNNSLILFNLKSGEHGKIFAAILKTISEKNIANGVVEKSSEAEIWASSAVDFYNKGDITQLRPISRQERYEICFRANGFLLFALAFLGILFLISSFIVLYYKLVSDSDDEAEQLSLLKKIGLTLKECRSYLQTHIAVIFFSPLVLGGAFGLYLVNSFVSFTVYRGSLMLSVATMFLAVAVVDILLFFSLRRRFFRDVSILG